MNAPTRSNSGTVTTGSTSDAVGHHNSSSIRNNDMRKQSPTQPMPVLIPIRRGRRPIPPKSDIVVNIDDDDDDDDGHTDHKNNGGNVSETLHEWAMIEINGELFLPPSAAATHTTSASTSNSDRTTTTCTIFDTHNHVELGSISFFPVGEASTTSTATTIQQLQVVPVMTIGTHELRGTMIPLQQPFLCLQKQHLPPSSVGSEAVVMEGRENDDTDCVIVDPVGNIDRGSTATTTTSTELTTEYQIMGIVKYKFIFNQYPKTIMRSK